MKTIIFILLLISGILDAQEDFSKVYQSHLVDNPFINIQGQFVYDNDYLLNMAMGGGSTVGNGGDAIYCRGSKEENKFWGYYALDYLLTYVKSNNNQDIVPVSTWEESRDRILSQLQMKAPQLAIEFKRFIAGMNNFTDYSQEIIWEEAPFGLLDLKDENIMRALPSNCYHANRPLIIQMIHRIKKSENFTTFEFNVDLYNLFRYIRPLQFSMIMLHEFSWSFTQDVSSVRKFVKLVHSKQFENYDKQGFNQILDNLNFTHDTIDISSYNLNLIKDIKLGNFELAKRWIMSGADINRADENNWTALMYAAQYGRFEIVQLLLQNGAFVNTRNNDGDTALFMATKEGYTEIVSLLLGAGAQLNLTNKKKQTSLIIATIENHIQIVKSLIDVDADLNLQDSGTWTALMHAAYYNHHEIVQELLTNGAKADLQNEYGGTALMYAAKRNSIQAVNLLVDAGANLNLRYNTAWSGNKEWTALMHAAYYNNHEIVHKLLANGANPNLQDKYGESALVIAASENNFQAVKLLVEVGADLNLQSNSRWTALIYAARNNSYRVVHTLLTNGANPDLQNKYGYTALMYAAENNNSTIVSELLAKGANPNIQDTEGKTALIMVIDAEVIKMPYVNYTKIAHLLLESNANPNLRDNEGRTAINCFPNLEVAQYLLEAGADPDANNGKAIRNSALNYHVEMMQLLLAAGANPNTKWTEEETVLIFCIKSYSNKSERMVNLLIAAGADLNWQDKDGNTALMWAVQYKNTEVVRWLLDAKADPNIKNNLGMIAYDFTKLYDKQFKKIQREIKKLLRNAGRKT